MPVVQIRLSERSRIGIGTFQPSDPKNQDIADENGVTMSPTFALFETITPSNGARISV
jgi:serine protein kinase